MTSYTIIPPLTVGTGVAKTSLGTTPKPSDAQNLIELIPYYAPTGAVTAGESALLETAVESVSVSNILPKRIINAPIQAGLGATFSTMIPILEAYECNTTLAKGSNSNIEVFGQAQVANTVGMVMGCALHYSDSPPSKPQMYYEKPDNETSTGTVITTVSGGTITINDGKMLQVLMAEVALATVTVSQSLIASMAFNSPNFANSQTIEVPCQPVSIGLSTLIGALQPKAAIYKNVNMGMKSSCTITTVLRLSEQQTVAGNFIGAVGYTK